MIAILKQSRQGVFKMTILRTPKGNKYVIFSGEMKETPGTYYLEVYQHGSFDRLVFETYSSSTRADLAHEALVDIFEYYMKDFRRLIKED